MKKAITDDRAAPKSANEVLTRTREDHNWRHEPADLTSTGGIQRAITAQWHAIQALADYIDGVATGDTDAEGVPIKTVAGSNSELPPVEQPDPMVSASAI